MADDDAGVGHRLKLRGQLGRGAYGLVYKGTFDGQPVAVKTVAQQDDHAATRLFHREARLLEHCDHRRIIGFKALVRMNTAKELKCGSGGTWALVLEYAKDGNLCQRVSRQMINPGVRVYSTAHALSWALDVASALEYLHLRTPAIFHRDVKLSNIVLVPEDGRAVAKLSDFGLHQVADSSQHRLMRRSSFSVTRPSTPASASDAGELARLRALAAAQADAPKQLGDSAWRPNFGGSGKGPAPDEHAEYSEIHDRAGSRVIVVGHTCRSGGGGGDADSSDSSSAVLSGAAVATQPQQGQQLPQQQAQQQQAQQQQQQAQEQPQAQQQPSSGGGSSAGAPARRPPPHKATSFTRAAHHPHSSEASARVLPASADGAAQPAAPAAADGASLIVNWAGWDFDAGSMCSAVTDGTWDSSAATAISNTDTAGSDLGDAGSLADDVETVFTMTGQTGSAMYMAPEVFTGQPYNEKADVFSFGCVLYELLARTLLIFTELPTSSTDPSLPDKYAAKVARGYRPARPVKRVNDQLWSLISACWHQDPVLRPHMSEVVSVLTEALAAELGTPRAGFRDADGRSCPSISEAGPPDSAAIPQPGCGCVIC